jgi:hypothetical protein
MIYPAFFLGSHGPSRDAVKIEAVLQEGEEPRRQDLHLAFGNEHSLLTGWVSAYWQYRQSVRRLGRARRALRRNASKRD